MSRENGQLSSEAAEQFDLFATPTRSVGVDGKRGPAVDRINVALDEMLQQDLNLGNVQINREGRVDRGHYAKRLGYHYTYICKSCSSTLDAWDTRLREINGGLSPTARAFVDLVRADAKRPAGVAARGKRIFLKSYAERIGVAPRLISLSMGPALLELEAELLEAGALHVKALKSRAQFREPAQGPARASRLRALLERDDQSPDGIRLNRRGRVDETHYATALGVKKLPPEASQIRDFWNDRVAERSNGLTPTGHRFLALIEAEKLTTKGIVTTGYRTIDLSYYAEKLTVSVAGIRLALGARLSSLNKTLAQQGWLRTPLERHLLTEVQADLSAGLKLKLGRGGKLHRGYYAERLGVDTAQLSRACRTLLESLDREHGANSNVEVRVDEMRRWLEDQYDRRVLPARDGKIDRALFQQEFGLKGGTFISRYPKIRALFEEFDARVAAENYVPAAFDTELQRLREALADAPELNKDRLSISRPALERKLGISLGSLWRSPFMEEIQLSEEKILHQAQHSLIDPYIAGRVFVFSDLADRWGRSFLTEVGSQFQKAFGHISDKENLKPRYLSFHGLLRWIGNADYMVCRMVVSLALEDQPIGQPAWDQAVFAYREQVVSEMKQGLRSKTQADGTIGSIRRTLAHMEPALPSMETDLPGIKYARAFTVHRASLAEASGETAAGAKYIEFANSMLRQAADRYKVQMDDDEAVNFTSALAAEMERSNDLPGDPAHAIFVVLDRRLTAIQNAASSIMDKARSDLLVGNELLVRADIDASRFYREYSELNSKSYAKKDVLRHWFPNPVGLPDDEAETARDRALANLFALAVEKFDGFLPGLSNERALSDLGQFFQKRYLELGTKETLGRFLNPDRDATGAALTLYLVESGANLAVGRTLEVDCIEAASQPGYKLITGHKARAKGKPIYAELPADSLAIRALEWYANHSARFRAKASHEERHYLFLHQVGERWQLATPHWYTNWFKIFARSIPALSQVDVAPSMIRPSVLLKAALENDGRLQVGRAIGQHSQAVTRGYQEKLPIRLLRDEHMRRFQRHFETRVLQNVVDVARNLGISADEFEQRIQELHATGLGTFCADPYGRPGSEGQRCQPIDCWRDCPQLLIVANVEAIALLQIWQRSLEDARGDWERDHPERWGEVWLPWLCLTEVVEKRMSRGSLLLIWNKAEKRAAELRAHPSFVSPRPF